MKKDCQINWEMKDCSTLQDVCTEAIESYLSRIEPLTYKALKMYVMEYKNAQEVSETLDIASFRRSPIPLQPLWQFHHFA